MYEGSDRTQARRGSWQRAIERETRPAQEHVGPPLGCPKGMEAYCGEAGTFFNTGASQATRDGVERPGDARRDRGSAGAAKPRRNFLQKLQFRRLSSDDAVLAEPPFRSVNSMLSTPPSIHRKIEPFAEPTS